MPSVRMEAANVTIIMKISTNSDNMAEFLKNGWHLKHMQDCQMNRSIVEDNT